MCVRTHVCVGVVYVSLIPWPVSLAISSDVNLAFKTDGFGFSVLEKLFFQLS